MNKIENLKLRKIEPIENQNLQLMMSNSSSSGEPKFHSAKCANGNSIACQYTDYYSTITDSKFNILGVRCDGKEHYCMGYPKESGSGSGSGNSGNTGNSWDPWGSGRTDYCRWCIWESCYNNPSASGSGSGSGSTWISSYPIGSGDSSSISTIFQSYGFARSTGRNTASASIFVPKRFSPANANDHWKISQLRIRCCSTTRRGGDFKIGLQRHGYGYPLSERTLFGIYGYAEVIFPFALNYDEDTRATIYFSSDDPGGGIYSWELLR